jgi:hypothetical protein
LYEADYALTSLHKMLVTGKTLTCQWKEIKGSTQPAFTATTILVLNTRF